MNNAHPNFEDIRRQVIVTNSHRKNIGPISTYKQVLDICDFDTQYADLFMISKFGGYTRGELNEIKYNIESNRKIYESKKLAPGKQVFV
ncbi:MAG: hypothetical protein WCR19_04545 [Acholeplasmataceae bacterium]